MMVIKMEWWWFGGIMTIRKEWWWFGRNAKSHIYRSRDLEIHIQNSDVILQNELVNMGWSYCLWCYVWLHLILSSAHIDFNLLHSFDFLFRFKKLRKIFLFSMGSGLSMRNELVLGNWIWYHHTGKHPVVKCLKNTCDKN